MSEGTFSDDAAHLRPILLLVLDACFIYIRVGARLIGHKHMLSSRNFVKYLFF